MAILGTNTDGAFSQAYSSDRKLVSRAAPATTGIVTTGGVRIWSAANVPARMVIYSDNAGEPNALLAVSNQTTITNTAEALSLFSFSGANQLKLIAGTFYWFGVHYQYTTSTVNVSRQNTTGGTRSNNDTYTDGASTIFGTTATTAGPIDAYLEYFPPDYGVATFRSSCDRLDDFDYADGSVTQTANTGYTGGGFNITYAGNYAQQLFRKAVTPSNIVQFRFKVATAATLSSVAGDAVLFGESTSSTYSGDANLPVQIRIIQSGTGFSFRLISPADSYAGAFDGVVYAKGRFHTVTLEKTLTGYSLYLNNNVTASCVYSRTNATATMQYTQYGNIYSVENALAGTVTFDDIFCRNKATVTTALQRVQDVYAGLEQRFDSGGSQVRPIDANDGVTAPRVVSESVAYKLLYTAQYLNKADMVRADNWCYSNLLRRNGATAPANPASNALNLMAFLYECNNYQIQDANWAGDADHERAQALLWAHARYGSSAFAVGTTAELADPNWLQRAMDVLADLRNFAYAISSATGFYYLMSDHLQKGNDTVQLAPDYDNPAAYKLFKQYDTANAAFWDLCVSGCYDLQTKAAAYIFASQTTTSSLTPNWLQFQLSTATVTGTSTYGDSDWGYNSPRMKSRAYDDFLWYGDTRARDTTRLGKTFVTSEWNTRGLVYAEYKHDGTPKPAATPYESRFFYAFYYLMLTVGDTANTVGSAIKTAKIDSTYVNHAGGSYYSTPGYFNTHWNARVDTQMNGLYINYGQAASSTQTLTVPTIASATTIYALIVTPGAVTISPPALPSSTTLQSPALATNILAVFILSATAIYAPAIVSGPVSLVLPTIASSASLTPPIVNVQAVSLVVPYRDSVTVLYTPTVSPGAVILGLPAVASVGAVYAPQLSTVSVSLAPPYLTSTASLAVPAMSMTVSAPAIASTADTYPATLSLQVVVPQLAGVNVLSPPSLGSVLKPPALASVAELYPASLQAGSVQVDVPSIASTTTVFAPIVGGGLAPPTIGSTTQLLAPVVSPQAVGVELTPLPSTTILYAVNLNLNVSVPSLPSASVIATPAVQLTIRVAYLSSESQLFAVKLNQSLVLSFMQSVIATSPPSLVAAGAVIPGVPIVMKQTESIVYMSTKQDALILRSRNK